MLVSFNMIGKSQIKNGGSQLMQRQNIHGFNHQLRNKITDIDRNVVAEPIVKILEKAPHNG